MTRNGSSIVSFKVPGKAFSSFQIMASHSDSPSFKIKENPEMEAENHYVKLNVEKYGGMLCAPWFDRPLSVAGRLAVKEGNRIATKLVKVDRDLLMIPNLAIHFNREVNDGYKYNAQVDMLPLYGGADAKGTFMELLLRAQGLKGRISWDTISISTTVCREASGGQRGVPVLRPFRRFTVRVFHLEGISGGRPSGLCERSRGI